jgi:hypothetical protein
MCPVNRLLITVAVCGLAVAGLSACSSTDQQQTKTVSYQESSPVQSLVVKGIVGDIQVIGGDGTSVSVTEKHRFDKTEPVASHTVVNGTLTLSYTCGDSHCGVDYTVTVPAGTKVQVTDSTGDVRLSRLAGTVQATTGASQISADGLTSPQVQLTTTTGDITVGFTRAPSSVTANVITGDVQFTVPTSVKYAVDAHADIGEVHVDVPQDPDGANKIYAKVGTGNVTVTNA